MAPAVDDDARATLAAKPNMRVLVMDTEAFRRPATAGLAREVRSVLGGLLVQARDTVTEATSRGRTRACAS